MIRDLTWSPDGRVGILLGPNGAGKSTLLRLLVSAKSPTAGAVTCGELTLPGSGSTLKQWRRRVGWVPQHIQPIPMMTTREQAAYAGWLKGMNRRDAERSAMTALERVGLTSKADEGASTLSGGQLRRLGIAAALVHDCAVVVMDEPTAGLDPHQRRRLHRLIAEMSDVEWLISTHQTEDLSLLEATVSVMTSGRITYQGSCDDFLALGDDEGSDRARAAYESLVGQED